MYTPYAFALIQSPFDVKRCMIGLCISRDSWKKKRNPLCFMNIQECLWIYSSKIKTWLREINIIYQLNGAGQGEIKSNLKSTFSPPFSQAQLHSTSSQGQMGKESCSQFITHSICCPSSSCSFPAPAWGCYNSVLIVSSWKDILYTCLCVHVYFLNIISM